MQQVPAPIDVVVVGPGVDTYLYRGGVVHHQPAHRPDPVVSHLHRPVPGCPEQSLRRPDTVCCAVEHRHRPAGEKCAEHPGIGGEPVAHLTRGGARSARQFHLSPGLEADDTARRKRPFRRRRQNRARCVGAECLDERAQLGAGRGDVGARRQPLEFDTDQPGRTRTETHVPNMLFRCPTCAESCPSVRHRKVDRHHHSIHPPSAA